MRTLFVEDHAALAEAIGDGLRRAGFAVDVVTSLDEAREALSLTRYDFALVDLGLPDGSGLELLPACHETYGIPVVILTARGALGDRVKGLDGGADDYIVKPVEMPELVARCRAVLRRPGQRKSEVLRVGDLRFDTLAREVFRGDIRLRLGRRELGLLEALMRRSGGVVPREHLLERLYSHSEEVMPNALEAATSRLRRELRAVGASVAIQTVRGIGWMLTEVKP